MSMSSLTSSAMTAGNVNSQTGEFESSIPPRSRTGCASGTTSHTATLRKVIRLLKYLRDFKGTFACPSAILTALLGERVFALDADTRYTDLPTALKNIVSDLDDWLQWHETMPAITDPSCPDVTFNHRWDQVRYANFRNRIRSYSAWVDDAYRDRPGQSVEKWQRVFGPDFRRRSRRRRRWCPSATRRARRRTGRARWSR